MYYVVYILMSSDSSWCLVTMFTVIADYITILKI